MKVEVKQTADGSNTLFVPDLNEHYHSVHGALQEAMHVFIKAGLEYKLRQNSKLNILEVGFGTGLNTILTLQHFFTHSGSIVYDTIEKYPLIPAIIESLHFEKFILNPELLEYFTEIHKAPWNKTVEIFPGFRFTKIEGQLESYSFQDKKYDLIYFDAFAPEKQPELWETAIFEKMAGLLNQGGALVSYCAKGSFKRSLKAVGLQVETLPGPPGKREMVRAAK